MIKTLYTLGIIIVVGIASSLVFAQTSEDDFYYQWFENNTKATTDQWSIVRTDVIQPNEGIIKKTIRLFNLDQYLLTSDKSALWYIKYIINVVLWLTSLVALVIIIYGFAKIIFADDDKSLWEARKTVQWAAIALVIIGVSRFVVSFLFTMYNTIANINR